jgi:RNA polymerase sigma-70 factor (ECF subfamily)
VKPISDDHILSVIQNGNSELGFSQLVGKYQEKLYWHIRKIVTVHEDADDVLQNTFLKIYKSIGKFKSKSALYTWIYRIATNEALTHLKKKKKKVTSHFSTDEINHSNMKADPYLDGSEVELAFQKAIEKLPDKQKLVFQMRYFDEMSYNEISAITTVSVGGLKASYHHAVKKLQNNLRKNIVQ